MRESFRFNGSGMTTNSDHDQHGIPTILHDQIKRQLARSGQAFPELDGLILRLGPHHIAHFIATTQDRDSAERLKLYLERYWPAYFVLIERMLHAASRDRNEELMSDFGQS